METNSTALAKVKIIEKDVIQFVKQGELIKVESDEDMVTATNYLSMLKDRFNRIETIRTEFVKPLNDTVKKLNTIFKSQQFPLTEIEKTVKSLMGVFYAKKAMEVELAQKKAVEAQKKAELVAKEKGEEVAPVPNMVEPVKTSVKTTAGTASMKKVWKFEIEDESKVPMEFLSVDEKKIREAIGEGARKIDGVKIFESTQVAIR